MKLYLTTALFLALISCESEPLRDRTLSIKTKTAVASDYASIGNLYIAIKDTLSGDHPDITTILLTAQEFTAFNDLYQQAYLEMSDSVLDSIGQAATVDFTAFSQTLTLSGSGAGQLELFGNTVQTLQSEEAPRSEVQSYIASSKGKFQTLVTLTDTDREILMVTATLAACALENEPGEGSDHGDDRDWELSIGHIAATAYGATFSRANAITAGLYGKFNL